MLVMPTARKRPKLSCGAEGGAGASPEENGEKDDDGQRPDQAQLFGGHGENEIGVGLGEIEKLLLAFHQAETGNSAGGDGDERLNDVEAEALGVGVGIQKREDAVPAVGDVENQEIERQDAAAKAYPK